MTPDPRLRSWLLDQVTGTANEMPVLLGLCQLHITLKSRATLDLTPKSKSQLEFVWHEPMEWREWPEWAEEDYDAGC